MNKGIAKILTAQPQSVGDGFVGKNAFHPQNSLDFSPYLLLDHHGPMDVKNSEKQKGVDEHPHRGFETITVVYQGALEHRDSAGNFGKLFPGDVQWMTAASGIVHEEKHEKEFSKKGGILEFVQLWVNLPAKYKMIAPRYQELQAEKFPSKTLQEGVKFRVIAGDLMGLHGIAETFSEIILADLELDEGVATTLNFTENLNISVYVLNGELKLNDTNTIKAGQIALLEQSENDLQIATIKKAKIIIIGGEKINEPLATHGPFVMNTREELMEAFQDFQAGKMGRLN